MKIPFSIKNNLKSLSETSLIKIFISLVLFLVLGITLFLTSKVYFQRIGVFGCFDQCFNYVAAYFILKGKTLYSQIFFNHQPLMAYLSYFIQTIFNLNSLYKLVLYHRLFILFFSLLMNAFLIWRFRWAGVGFVLFYETTKYYLFGNFFLPEAIIAYFLAYLIGLLWEKLQQRELSLFDYLIAAVFSWLIVFLRVIYLPVALALFAFILLPSTQKKKSPILLSFFLFLLLSLLTLFNLPLNDYFYQVFILNFQMMSMETQAVGTSGLGILKIFLYPFLILFTGKWNYLRTILIGLDIIFLALMAWFVLKTKKWKEALLIFFILGLAAIRYTEPGTTFYEAFHLLTWYSLFLMAIFLLLIELRAQPKGRYFFLITVSFLVILFTYTIFSSQSFIWEKVNREEEFTVNYAHYFAQGNLIKLLSKPNDTLFLEQWDDLIYWRSGLDSSYQYSLYTPIMTNSEKFNQARLTMFRQNPPDFYYAYYGAGENCPPLFPSDMVNDYAQIYFGEKPSCLYIRKENLAEITPDQWEEVKKLGFFLPTTID